MDMFKKYLLNTAAVFAPRERVAEALADDEPYEPDAVGDDADDLPAEGDEDAVEGDEDLEDLEAEPEPEPEPRTRSRGQRRIETLSTQNRALEQQVADSQARLAALEARLSNPQPTQQAVEAQQRDEDARLALMSPEERLEYRLNRTLAGHSAQVNSTLASVQDHSDRQSFREVLRDKPQFKVHEKAVEAEFKRLNSLRTPMTREAILMFIVGQKAVQTKGKPQPKARSQQRLREQEARPVSASGDVRGDRRSADSTASARERRLSNVRL